MRKSLTLGLYNAFYRATYDSAARSWVGCRNSGCPSGCLSACLSVTHLSVTHVLYDETKKLTANILIPYEKIIALVF